MTPMKPTYNKKDSVFALVKHAIFDFHFQNRLGGPWGLGVMLLRGRRLIIHGLRS